MAKYPKNLADAIKVIKQLESDLCIAHNERIGLIQPDDYKAAMEAKDANFKRYALAAKERDEAIAIRENVHKQFDDLKQRLHDAEMELSKLRGYIDRVREDDIVREELITSGDPEGEQRMVPKRKMRDLFSYEHAPRLYDEAQGVMGYAEHRREKPKRWVNY